MHTPFTRKCCVLLSVIDIFLFQNYTTSMNFLREFEKYCRSQENILKLRSHPSYVSFISRWSLPIYFQIRLEKLIFTVHITLSVKKDINNYWSEERPIQAE